MEFKLQHLEEMLSADSQPQVPDFIRLNAHDFYILGMIPEKAAQDMKAAEIIRELTEMEKRRHLWW